MQDPSVELLDAVREIRDLIRLMAEPAVAERDRRFRDELRQVVGKSQPKAKAVLLMDGNRTQTEIHAETSINKGHLSTLVKRLTETNLQCGDARRPKLAISIPSSFFDAVSDE